MPPPRNLATFRAAERPRETPLNRCVSARFPCQRELEYCCGIADNTRTFLAKSQNFHSQIHNLCAGEAVAISNSGRSSPYNCSSQGFNAVPKKSNYNSAQILLFPSGEASPAAEATSNVSVDLSSIVSST
jgi:hypothetical protein